MNLRERKENRCRQLFLCDSCGTRMCLLFFSSPSSFLGNQTTFMALTLPTLPQKHAKRATKKTESEFRRDKMEPEFKKTGSQETLFETQPAGRTDGQTTNKIAVTTSNKSSGLPLSLTGRQRAVSGNKSQPRSTRGGE